MAYATVDEKTLYIHGGFKVPNSNIFEPQFFSLDLTQDTWDVSNPPWKQLPYSNVFGNTAVLPAQHALTVSQDGRTLSMWIGGEPVNKVFANYSITDNKWTRLSVSYNLFFEVRAATDPTTGMVYFPAGDGLFTKAYQTLVKVDPSLRFTAEDIPLSAMHIPGTPNAFVWNKLRSSFIIYLDSASAPPPAYPFYEYTPSNRQWKALNTTGPYPIKSMGGCMVAAYEGTKMIVFGGIVDSTTTVGDIYIIDMLTMKVTKGPTAPAPRYYMACAVAGDNFISWGGYSKDAIFEPTALSGTGTPLIYNIHSGQWVKKYVRGSSYKPPTTPSPSPTNGVNPPGDAGGDGEREGEDAGGDIKSVSGAAVGGGVAGGFVAIAAIAFIFVRRRRQSRDHHRDLKHPEYIPHNEHNDTKHSEYTAHYDQEPPSFGITDTRPFPDAHFDWTQIQEIPGSPQIIRNDPQGTPSSSHSTIQSPLVSSASIPPSSPFVLPLSNSSVQSSDQQKRVRSMDQHLLAMQEQTDPQKGSPQYYPIADRTLSPTTLRGPQGGGEAEPASKTTIEELQYQMEVIQNELKRRDIV
ncbi:hypothetical protein EC991_011031 [Linnemannia zychae]|nr:hypothetical protein EC991_011031 [Linnemannia zychae]